MILGYKLDEITAKKEKNIAEQLDISSTPKITEVKESEINLGEKKKVVSVSFEFLTEYKPSVGSIAIKGEVYYTGQNREVLKEWKEKKRLPAEVDAEIKNFLFRKCLILGINLSQELQLPPPLMFPIVVPKEKEEQKYIG